MLVLHGGEHQLDLTQISHRITKNQGKIILQVKFNAGAQARALRKENKMLQLEDALNNLRNSPSRLVHLHIGVIILRNDRLLLRKIAHALEDKVRAATRDLHIEFLTERIHVATDLLEIEGGHVNDTREVEARDLDILHIRVEEFEEVVRDR